MPARSTIKVVAARKPFLLRMDPALMEALQHWADDELRSLNGQIEYLLRLALQREKRLPPTTRAVPRASGKQG